ncbi:MAG: four helix bundle protein [Bacteroidia bacterium]
MHNFRELKIWKGSMEITKFFYSQTKLFLSSELYSLTSQINRAAVSIHSNIAEGAGRYGNKEFCQFLNIAIGSFFELETQMILAHDFGYIKKEDLALFII